MIELVKIIGIGFLTVVCTIILKEYKKDFALYVVLIGSLLILYLSFDILSNVIDFLRDLSSRAEIDNSFITFLLKITGISILSEFAISICKDLRGIIYSKQNRFRRKNNCYIIIYSGNRMLIRTIISTIAFIILLTSNIFATEEIIKDQKSSLGINDFISKSQEYTKDIYKDTNLNKIFDSMIKGQISDDFIFDGILISIKKQFSENISLMIKILIVVIIHSILKSISENLGNDSTSKIVYFLQYVIIASMILDSFGVVISLTKNTIGDVVDFMKLLIPLLITLMLTTGQFAFSNIVQPILILMINVIGEIIERLIIPLVMISMSLSIVSNFSKEITVDKLSKFVKKTSIWILGIMLTIFVGTLAIEGTLGKSVDNLTAKTAKAVVSDFIPVFGKILGDTAETIIGCSKVLKNSVGIIGVIVVLGIVIVPIIKIATLWISFKITACLCEVVADEKIVKFIDQVSDCYQILLGVLVAVSVMLIIGITIVLKSTG